MTTYRWQPIAEAQFVPLGTVANLKMKSGRVYRATWRFYGVCCAWWPDSKQRKRCIGLYQPISFQIVAHGMDIDARNVPHASATVSQSNA